jgi:hypothetical protein
VLWYHYLRIHVSSVDDEGPKKSGYEYELQANEGCEEGVSKVQILLDYTTMCIMSIISH